MFRKKGFTLIELLIVVAIIAILAAIAIPNFLSAQVRSKVSRAQSDMRTINTALESYYVDNNDYPYVYYLPSELNGSTGLPELILALLAHFSVTRSRFLRKNMPM